MEDALTRDEQKLLLKLARNAISQAVIGNTAPLPDLCSLPARLGEPGTCFVTLTMTSGELRGCIGGLEARLPLAHDVCEHAIAAAMDDYRFYPVQTDELSRIKIEISRLTPPKPLIYETPEELPARLQPFVDGVVLRYGSRRSTFLPQVWEKIPEPAVFLSQLCLKMDAPSDLWRRKKLEVEIYHVEEFHEDE